MKPVQAIVIPWFFSLYEEIIHEIYSEWIIFRTGETNMV